MNEELQKQIAAILQQALSAVQHGGQWLSGQIPDVLHQLLLWTVCVGVAWAVFIAVSTFACVRVWRLALRWMDESEGMSLIGAMFATGLVLCVDLFGGISGVMNGLQALVAPKLFLLEYAAHLVK